MALYYYYKYYIDSNTTYQETSWDLTARQVEADGNTIFQGGTSYSFNSSTGRFSTEGSIQISRNNTGTVYMLENSGTSLRKAIIYYFGGLYLLNAWYKTIASIITYSCGGYITTITAEEGTYPYNDRYNGYWYKKGSIAWQPPNIQLKVNDVKKQYENGWVKIDGQLKQIDAIWVKIDGILKQS